MKYLFAILTAISLACPALADEQTMAHFKVTYQSGYDKAEKTEMEADALVKQSFGSTTRCYVVVLPLVLPAGDTWSCSFMLPDDQPVLQAEIGEQLPVKDGSEAKSRKLLSTSVPFKSGVDTMLVKNAAYTLTVNIKLDNAAADPTAKPAPEPQAQQPAPKYLTAEEITKLEISCEVYTSGSSSGVTISGHNAFPKNVTGGVLKVSIPKTDSTPEINREYAFALEALPLQDFGAELGWSLKLTKDQKPTFTVEKLQFAP